MRNWSVLSILFAMLFFCGCGNPDAVNYGSLDDSALAKTVHNEVEKSLGNHEVISDREDVAKLFAGTPTLRQIRDSVSYSGLAYLGEQSDDYMMQLFAYYVCTKRFPDKQLEMATRILLTTKRPAVELMNDIYLCITSAKVEQSGDSLFGIIEGTQASEGNYAVYIHLLSPDILNKWLDSRSAKMSTKLRAMIVGSLCSKIPREQWSKTVGKTLNEFADSNGESLLVYLVVADPDEKDFSARLVRYLNEDVSKNDLITLVGSKKEAVKGVLERDDIPQSTKSRIRNYLNLEKPKDATEPVPE